MNSEHMVPVCRCRSNQLTNVLKMVTGTLNTSTGPIVSEAHLGAALRAGSLDAIDDEKARASVAYLFVELVMHLEVIPRCCDAVGVPIAQAQKLYLQTVAEGLPRVPAWEAMVANSRYICGSSVGFCCGAAPAGCFSG